MKRNRQAVISMVSLLALMGATLLSYQNCAKVDATKLDDAQASQSVGKSGEPTASPTPSATPAPSATPIPTMTPSPTPSATPSPTIAPSSNLVLNVSATVVVEGQAAELQVQFQNVTNVNLSCVDKVTGASVLNKQVTSSGSKSSIVVNQDLLCKAQGTSISGMNLVQMKEINLDCQNRIKNSATGRCEDFSCKSVVQITDAQDLLAVPARNSNGICYAIKLLKSVQNSASTLTTGSEQDIVSREHGVSTLRNRNPFLLGKALVEFKVQGARVIKLSGGLNATSPILVDNFILTGLFPSSVNGLEQAASYYRVRGTSDSSVVDANGRTTNYILFQNTQIPVEAYASAATSSVTPVDLTKSIVPDINYTLDLRALDCGGVRELSDVYLLFQ